MERTRKTASPYGSRKYTSIDDYHADFPEPIQEKLAQLRSIIKEAAPQAVETISYNMPCFKLQKNLVYYAAYKNHIGFYPTAKPIIVFKEALSAYKTSKGAIQFPLHTKLPETLIKKIVVYRIKEVEQ